MQCWGLIYDRRRLNCDFVIFFTGLHTYHYTMHVLVFITDFNKPTLSRTYCMAILDAMNNMVLFMVTSHVPEPHSYMSWSWPSLCLQMPQDLMVIGHQQPHRRHKFIHDFSENIPIISFWWVSAIKTWLHCFRAMELRLSCTSPSCCFSNGVTFLLH